MYNVCTCICTEREAFLIDIYHTLIWLNYLFDILGCILLFIHLGTDRPPPVPDDVLQGELGAGDLVRHIITGRCGRLALCLLFLKR